MENPIKRSLLNLTLAFALALTSAFSNSVFAQGQENYENDGLVGRILHIEGQLLRYMPDEDDWEVTEKDTPFGAYDVLYSSDDGKVEIIMPNNTLVRIGGDTQVQLIELNNEVTEIDVSSGSARLYNKSSSAEIRVTTPFGNVLMPPETSCDLYVYDTQAEIVAVKGSVEFMQSGSNSRHEVIAGFSSIIATPQQITAAASSVSPKWDAWNADRDVKWTQRMARRGESGKYLPESLQEDASVLEKNGRWEQVNYEGANNYFWRPAYVGVGWTPFSSGRWISWHGEQTWVPYDSFGYVTHHYGNWVYAGNHWYWAPPVSRVMVRAGVPLLNIGISWYPGRVAWMYSGLSIGWYPLGCYETYYSHNYWGPRSRIRCYNHYYDHDRHNNRHRRHARFIDHDRFYSSDNYRHAGLRKMRRGEKYRGSAFIPNKIKKHRKSGNRHRLASANDRFRKKIAKIDKQRKKRIKQKSWNNFKDNPFKRKFDKAVKNNRKVNKKIFEKRKKKVFKNNKLVKKRMDSARKKFSKGIQKSKEKRSRIVKANKKKRRENFSQAKKTFQKNAKNRADRRKKSFSKAKKSFERTSRKIADNRKNFQKSVQKSVKQNKEKFNKKRRNKPSKNLFAKQNRADKQFLSNRSEKKFLANHSKINRSKSRKNNSGSIFKQNKSNTKRNFGKAFASSKKHNRQKNIVKQFRNNNSKRSAKRNIFKTR